MKRILVTHTDLDGAGCAILFKRQYPDIEIRYCDYDIIDRVSKELWIDRDQYDAVWFSDITPNEEMGRKMAGDQKFVLIDHHVTREYLRELSDRPNIIYNTEICATYLSMIYLFPGYKSEFVYAIDAYDTWKLDSPYRDYGVDLNLLFNYYKMDKFVKRFSVMGDEMIKGTPFIRKLNSIERIVIHVLKNINDKYLAEKLKQGTIETDDNGNKYFKVYTAEKGGHIGVLADDPKLSDCEYIKVININDKVVGLYSKDFDVSEIAKANGGGGHKTAAGYELKSFKLCIYAE